MSSRVVHITVSIFKQPYSFTSIVIVHRVVNQLTWEKTYVFVQGRGVAMQTFQNEGAARWCVRRGG